MSLSAVLWLCQATVAQQTLYFDDFSGAGGNLNGVLPDMGGGSAWVASSLFNADGSIEAANGGSATLAFTPTFGNIYTLEASFRGLSAGAGADPTDERDWLALGFAAGQSSGSTGSDRFINNNVIGKAWHFVRGATNSGSGNSALIGSNSSGTVDGIGWSSLNNAFGGDMDLRIVLDTTQSQSNWNATWYAKRPTDASFTQVRGMTALQSNLIDSVGIAKSNTGITGSISNFSLTSETGQDPPLLNQYISSTPIGSGYARGRINATSYARNNVVTVGDQQFLTYYEPTADGGNVIIARRTIGQNNWIQTETSFVSNNIDDNHNIIAMAVDGDGIMHLSWGMHAKQQQGQPYNYARSTGSVLTPGQQIQLTPNLEHTAMPGIGDVTRVTYPEFVNLPDGDLLYFFRSGGSGNGDMQLNRYDVDTNTWSALHLDLLDGNATQNNTTANAYWNTPTLDDDGNLHLSWLYRRSASGLQANRDLHYAVSPDGGVTWLKDDGTPYSTPITQDTADVVIPIPENSSYINSTSMAVDQNSRPVIATRFAPNLADGDDQVQQMLMWFDGSNWQSSQVTNLASGDEGHRPSVLVDKDGRVMVMISDSDLGGLVLAHSMDRQNWEYIELVSDDLGSWEPTYDPTRWEHDGVISILLQPMGLGTDAEAVSLFEFDARNYFDDLLAQLPGDANGDGQVTAADLVILDANFGQAGTFSDGDFNGDGVVTAADLVILDANFGAGVSQASPSIVSSIPEPSSISLLGLGVTLLIRRQCHTKILD
ncbi:MAG: BNR-4 repeat-containing protein [Planctomycetota bacterium]